MDDDSRLDRIEKNLEHVLMLVSRLESRLVHAGILPGGTDDSLRYALEYKIEAPSEFDERQPIPESFLNRVIDYLNVHERDEKPTFYEMEESFNENSFYNHRMTLIHCLHYLALRGQFESMIDKMVNGLGSAPVEAQGVYRAFYKRP